MQIHSPNSLQRVLPDTTYTKLSETQRLEQMLRAQRLQPRVPEKMERLRLVHTEGLRAHKTSLTCIQRVCTGATRAF